MSGNMFFRNCEQNALFNIASSLNFNDRYNFSVISKTLLEKVFEKYQHQKIININYKEYEKIDKYPNMNFYIKNYYMHNNLSNHMQKKILKKIINAYGIDLYEINIHDMSIFKNLYKVHLCMTNTTDLDISKLTNIRVLHINSCKNIHNIPYLKHLHTFLLTNNDNVSNISNLSHVKNIKFNNCFKIINFEPIKNINYLDLYSHDKKNISTLTNIKYLKLHSYQDISSLLNIKVLIFSAISKFYRDGFFILPIINYETLILKYFNINNNDLFNIHSCKIKHLILFNCNKITKMPIFDNLEQISIYHCRKISDISNLNLSPKLKIINTDRYKKLNYTNLTNIKQINMNKSFKKMISKYPNFN